MKNFAVDKNIPILAITLQASKHKVYEFVGTELTNQELVSSEAEFLIVRSTTKVNASLLENTNIKAVMTATSGIEHIDLDYLLANKISFFAASGSNSNSVAEYVIYAILYWMRQRIATTNFAELIENNTELIGNNISLLNDIISNSASFSLLNSIKKHIIKKHTKVGIIGYGHIGKKVKAYLDAMQIESFVNDPPLANANNANNANLHTSCDLNNNLLDNLNNKNLDNKNLDNNLLDNLNNKNLDNNLLDNLDNKNLDNNLLDNLDNLNKNNNNKFFFELEELLETCNVFTVHTPFIAEGTYSTLNLLDTEFIGKMKTGSLLINAARGGIVDEAALLERKSDLYYAIDTWQNEPDYDINFAASAMIATPHIAGHSYDGKLNATMMIIRELNASYQLDLSMDYVMAEFSCHIFLMKKYMTNYDNIFNHLVKYRKFDSDLALMKLIKFRTNEDKIKFFKTLRDHYPVRNEVLCKKKRIEKKKMKASTFSKK